MSGSRDITASPEVSRRVTAAQRTARQQVERAPVHGRPVHKVREAAQARQELAVATQQARKSGRKRAGTESVVQESTAAKQPRTSRAAMKALAAKCFDGPNGTHAKVKEVMERDGGVLQWATEHNCTFGIAKWQLVDYTAKTRPAGVDPANPRKKKREPAVGTAVEIGGRLIEVKTVAKFLGILVDSGLRWKEQGTEVIRKGGDWIAKLRRTATVTKGMKMKFVRRAYLGTAIPRILYGADLFLTPKRYSLKMRKDHRSGHPIIRQLESIHRQAAIIITGAMRTTAGDILSIHANMLPMDLIVDLHLHRAAVRYATLPKTHPMHDRIRKAARYPNIKRHRSPLHWLVQKYRIKPNEIETIQAIRYDTTWTPKTTLIPVRDAVEGIELDEEDEGLRIYTDGSGYEGGVGASAVLFDGDEMVQEMRVHLGPAELHEVYEGEGGGLVLATAILKRVRRRVTRIVICVDSMAALRAAQSSKPGPAHYIFDAFHQGLHEVQKIHPDIRVEMCWVPAHLDVPGNEAADKEAKRAAEDPTSSTPAAQLPIIFRKPLPSSATAIKRVFRQKLQEIANRRWRDSTRRAKFKRIATADAVTVGKKYSSLVDTLSRRVASLVIQLRTGHAPLHAHLHRIRKTDSPECPACHHYKEDVPHYLLHCPAYRDHRERLKRKVKRPTGDLELTHLLNEPKNIPHLLQFVADTARFTTDFAPIQMPKPPPRTHAASRDPLQDAMF